MTSSSIESKALIRLPVIVVSFILFTSTERAIRNMEELDDKMLPVCWVDLINAPVVLTVVVPSFFIFILVKLLTVWFDPSDIVLQFMFIWSKFRQTASLLYKVFAIKILQEPMVRIGNSDHLILNSARIYINHLLTKRNVSSELNVELIV